MQATPEKEDGETNEAPQEEEVETGQVEEDNQEEEEAPQEEEDEV